MPTKKDLERRLEHLENLALFGGGVAAGTASGRHLAKELARRAAPVAGRAALRGAGTIGRTALFAARRHPVGAAATLAAIGYIHREEIADVAEAIAPHFTEEIGAGLPGARATISKPVKRKVNGFSRDVKKAMKMIKGSKFHGKKGIISNSKAAFKTATKAASKARKKGAIKGRTAVATIARKLRRK